MNLYSTSHLEDVWKRMRNHPVSGTQKKLAVGIDGMRADQFETHLSNCIAEISRKVLHINDDNTSSYQFAPLLKLEKNKNGGGVRNLYIPRIRDQVVIRAMHEDIVNTSRQHNINLKLPSPAKVIESFRASITNFKDPVVLRTDIQSFYDSVPRDKVIELAVGLGLNEFTVKLLTNWSDNLMARSPWISGKATDFKVNGLPQGLSISASLSELWATQIDNIFQEKYHYFRYVDDIAILCESIEEATLLFQKINHEVSQLGLILSTNKTEILKLSSGVTWLGLTHLPDKIIVDQSRVDRWLKRFIKIHKNTSHKIREAKGATSSQEIIDEFLLEINSELKGKTSTRTSWYAEVEDHGQWKIMDKTIHALIRSVFRQLDTPVSSSTILPSVHRVINMKKKNK